MRFVLAILLFSAFSCFSQSESKKASWKTENYINKKQILLTNEYKLGGAMGYGASSFLLKTKKGVPVICSAKHLLGSAMGISPEVTTKDFNEQFVYWKAYPRSDQLSTDTVRVKKLINEEINSTDIVLFEMEKKRGHDFQVLEPRYSKAKPGEKFEIIGCEYADQSCHQKIYLAETDEYDKDGMLVLKAEKKFQVSGFSGAPVIDENGLVIGVLRGAGEFTGNYYVWIEPLTKVKKWLE